MKRRLFLTSLFATAATIACSDPTQARSRRRGRRASRSSRRGTAARTRTAYQPVSHTATRNTGASVVSEQPRRQPRRTDHQNAIATRPTAAPSDPYAQTRGRNGRLTEDNIHAFRSQFDGRQSRQAMRAALGEPAEHTLTGDRWRISQTDIYGKPAEDGWFEADYGTFGVNWDSKTVRPPTAKW